MSPSDFQVCLKKSVVKFTLHGVPDRPGMAAEIFDRLSQSGINVELVVQTAGGGSITDLSLAVSQDDIAATDEELNQILDPIRANSVSKEENVALLTLEKEKLSKVPGAAARMFRTLAQQGINIDLISTSLSSINCLIAEDRSQEAYQALRREFDAEA